MALPSEERMAKLREDVRNLREYGLEAASRLLGEVTEKAKKLDAALSKGDAKVEEIQALVNSLGPSLQSLQTVLRLALHYERQIWNLVNLGRQ